jgi:hypothetical protein
MHPLTKQRLVPERILKEALWQQVQLRSKIESASERDIKLNMTIPSINKQKQDIKATSNQDTHKRNDDNLEGDDDNEGDDGDDGEEDDAETVEEESLKKYYPIPTDDTTTYTGESAITLASSTSTANYGKKRLSSQHRQASPSSPMIAVEQYSIYPPFRFSVEFADVTSLKHGMRVYSDTVFYAG